MTKKDKLIDRFFSCPKDFTWRELQQVLVHFGYTEHPSGRGVKFINDETQHVICLHPPHPGNIVKRVYLKNVANTLKENSRL